MGFLDRMAAEPAAGMIDTEAGTQKPGLFSGIEKGVTDSAKAAGMMLGLYKPANPEEAKVLRRKFYADAASLATATGVGFAAETGGASLPISVVARTILA